MGKNGRFGKDYGTVVGKDTRSRPGWKGPGYVKKTEPPLKSKRATQDEKADAEVVLEPAIPAELQQLLLNVYQNSFPSVLLSDTLQTLLQEVKKALYERDFTRAFGKDEFLEAYSIRWSPSRTLCYQSILVDLQKHLAEVLPACKLIQPDLDIESAPDAKPTMRAICFGGGAAEVVAFGGFLRYLQDALSRQSVSEDCLAASDGLVKLSLRDNDPDNDPNQQMSSKNCISVLDSRTKIDLLLVDTAQWQDVVHKLHESLTTPPPLSKYASSSAKEANEALTEMADFNTTFLKDDMLGMSESQLVDAAGQQPVLLTLLFTLNELYTSSIGKTTTFLLNLTAAVTPGSLLLVVDSPGSYSEAAVGTEAKKYPMHWLLDHTLLETQKSGGKESPAEWVKLVSEDSKWFRMPENLRYPIPLENMRYQMHLYRRL
jgi:25S rRNA (uracil2843-N3)-methyltransferase